VSYIIIGEIIKLFLGKIIKLKDNIYWVDKKVMRNFFKIFCNVAAIVFNFDFIYDMDAYKV
jgi:hypothetical protein